MNLFNPSEVAPSLTLDFHLLAVFPFAFLPTTSCFRKGFWTSAGDRTGE